MPTPKKTVVKHFPKPKSLNEDYQSTGIKFSFVTSPEDGLLQCHEWVKCRDFMPDAVKALITKTTFSIYGFVYDPNKNPAIDLSKIRVIVSKQNMLPEAAELFHAQMKSALKLLNHYERFAGTSLSRLEKVTLDKPNGYDTVFMFVGPKMWLTSPILISMYTFLIRLGDKQIKFRGRKELIAALKDLNERSKRGGLSDNDARYLGSSWDKLHLILENREALFPLKNGYHDAIFGKFDRGRFHHNMGVKALCDCSTPDQGLNQRMRAIIEKGEKKK